MSRQTGAIDRDPIQVQYSSTAYFSEDSEIVPKPDFLNSVLEQSLDDPQEYIDLLSELNSDSVFSTATDAVFAEPDESPSTEEDDGEEDDGEEDEKDVDEEDESEANDGEEGDNEEKSTSSTTTSSTKNVAGFVGAAVGCTLLAAVVVLYRGAKPDDSIEKDCTLNKKGRAGDATVSSGETHIVETLDGSTQICPSEGLFRDEEDVNLKSHAHEDDSTDTARQTAALWEQLQSDSCDEGSYQDLHLRSSSPHHRRSNSTNQAGGEKSRCKKISTPKESLENFDAYVGYTARSHSDLPSILGPSQAESHQTLLPNEAKGRQSQSTDSINGSGSRRPRTVAEIEKILAMDADI